MLLSQAWIYKKHQGAVITSTAVLDESLQLVLLSHHMVTKGPFIAPLVCQRVYLA